MDLPLVLAGALLGLGGSPHCATMCGAPCAALTAGGRRDAWRFHAARVVSYSAGGALVAASVSALGSAREWMPAMRALWVLLHAAMLAFGLYLLITGRQPAWRSAVVPLAAAAGGPRWQPIHGPGGPQRQRWLAGLAWVAWPCGLLHSALLSAALANGPAGGAAVMAAFAIATVPALWAGSALLQRLGAATQRRAVRAAGGVVAAASLWALGHGVWERAIAWCLS